MICKSYRKHLESTNKIHIILILTTLITVFNIIKRVKDTGITPEKILVNNKLKDCYLQSLSIVSNMKNRRMMKSDYRYSRLIILLILLSNDINKNPGPMPENSKLELEEYCNMCNQPIKKEEALKCDTCRKWCHYNCAGNQNTREHNSSFEWICQNPYCSPNHEEHSNHGAEQTKLVSPNRYTLLEGTANNSNIRSTKKTHKVNKTVKPSDEDRTTKKYSLLNELPKITSKDFIGKDLCRSCFKEVKACQPAISCDLCMRWIHRSCSDMSTKLYNQSKKKKHFPWICNKCRCDDEGNNDKADLSKLRESDIPEKVSSIKSTSKELTIIHLNCRSIINKVEELELVTQESNADISSY